MRPHKLHVEQGPQFCGETYIFCECGIPGGMSLSRKLRNEDCLFQGTTRDELTAFLERHPEETSPQLPVPVRKNKAIAEFLFKRFMEEERRDPLIPLERFLSRLPNPFLNDTCDDHGKPVTYWSFEEGGGCRDCARENMFLGYIPAVIMWNIMERFGITDEETRERIFAIVKDPFEEDGNEE